MHNFTGKMAVVTGGGTGMGRALVRQLAGEGCHVATCDVSAENMAETKSLCASGVRVTTHVCDVSDEDQVVAFRDAVVREHATTHVNLLFNNAGISGGGSFVNDDRTDWDKTFAVCWSGVYFCTRTFMPLLVASDEGYIVNTSSVNGFWAHLGPQSPHTAYAAAKFAVKGFSEALITDLRLNAPHVKVAVVMPGHVGTSIVINSRKVLGRPDPEAMTEQQLAEARKRWGAASDGFTDDQIRAAIRAGGENFRDNAPVTADQAAGIILDGVRNNRWRILVGDDAHRLDAMVRSSPETVYDA